MNKGATTQKKTTQTTEESAKPSVFENVEKAVERKPLKIFQVKNTALYRVGFEGGGELPQELSGMWTTPNKAQDAIDTYVAKRDG